MPKWTVWVEGAFAPVEFEGDYVRPEDKDFSWMEWQSPTMRMTFKTRLVLGFKMESVSDEPLPDPPTIGFRP